MARMTGSFVNARAGSVWDCAWGALADEGAAENAERGTRKAEQGCSELAHLFRVPPSAFRVSQDPIHQRAQEHDDAHDPVHREERRVEPRQIAWPHQLVLVGDEHGGSHDGREVREPKPRAQPERHEGRSEEHTSELQSRLHLVCRLLLEKKKKKKKTKSTQQKT